MKAGVVLLALKSKRKHDAEGGEGAHEFMDGFDDDEVGRVEWWNWVLKWAAGDAARGVPFPIPKVSQF